MSIEADEILARCFQHELDHLDGVLLLERLDADTRKAALKTIRELGIGPSCAPTPSPRATGCRSARWSPPAPRHPRRLASLGTPDASVVPLRALVEAGHDVALVVSRADRRRGRGGRIVSVAGQAGRARPRPARSPMHRRRAGGGCGPGGRRGVRPPDPSPCPRRPADGQPALLPVAPLAGRGPVERAILAGDERTGVDLMVVEEGLDTGGIYTAPRSPSGPTRQPPSCGNGSRPLSADMLVDDLREGLGEPVPQVG